MPSHYDRHVWGRSIADIVSSENVGDVFESPGGQQLPPQGLFRIGNTERDKNDLGTTQRQTAHRLWEVGIVTENDADLPMIDIEHRIARARAEVDRLDAQIRHQLTIDNDVAFSANVRLAVFAHNTVRSN